MTFIRAEYVECPTCKAKPGSPALCRECLERRELFGVNERLRAEVADLEARLKAARRGMGVPWCPTMGLHECCCSECVGLNATDLRVKNWRKP